MAVNWSGSAQGAVGGALSGAGTGAMFGPWGALIGAGLGGTAGFLGGLFGGGEEGGVEQIDLFPPQQKSALATLLGMGQMNLGNPHAGFQPIQQNAKNFFLQQLVPELQTQFSGSGSNAISSPQLQTNLSSAGAGLAERLAAMQSEFGQRNQQLGLKQLALGLSPQFENIYKQSQPGFGENLLSGSIQAAPQFYQAYQQKQANDALFKLLGQGVGA